jgi:hypothetical protein
MISCLWLAGRCQGLVPNGVPSRTIQANIPFGIRSVGPFASTHLDQERSLPRTSQCGPKSAAWSGSRSSPAEPIPNDSTACGTLWPRRSRWTKPHRESLALRSRPQRAQVQDRCLASEVSRVLGSAPSARKSLAARVAIPAALALTAATCGRSIPRAVALIWKSPSNRATRCRSIQAGAAASQGNSGYEQSHRWHNAVRDDGTKNAISPTGVLTGRKSDPQIRYACWLNRLRRGGRWRKREGALISQLAQWWCRAPLFPSRVPVAENMS